MSFLIKIKRLDGSTVWFGKGGRVVRDRARAQIFPSRQVAEEYQDQLVDSLGDDKNNFGIEIIQRRLPPAYRKAIEYIALNDEPTYLDMEEVDGLPTVQLAALLFETDPQIVASDVIAYRMRKSAS